MRRALALGLIGALVGCNSTPEAPAHTGPAAETASPADSPMQYKVLSDEFNVGPNTSDYHVLIADSPKHDDVEKLLKYLYRHQMTRRDPQPSAMSASVYSNEAQYKTPPRSPIATVLQKSGDIGPTFDNKVPLEFWQQVDEALPHTDKAWKLAKKIERDDPNKSLTITQPYTEPGVDEYAKTLSFNLAMNVFTDTAKELFEKVPELRAMKFVGRWKDNDVVKIELDRAGYQAINISDIEEQIGQLHGRAFLELSTQKGTDASVTKGNNQRMAAVYKKMLGQLKGKAFVDKSLK